MMIIAIVSPSFRHRYHHISIQYHQYLFITIFITITHDLITTITAEGVKRGGRGGGGRAGRVSTE